MSDIRFGEPVEPPVPEEKLPPERLLIPTPGYQRRRSDPFQVYIVKDVLEKVWGHVRKYPRIESGGVLIGHPFREISDPTITFIIIVGAIRQDSTNRSAGHFTVGPREIAAARAIMEQRHPGLVPVGWYHSHPGHGVFLSGQDMQIVRSIYNAEWQVALVLDPYRGESAFFRGSKGERLPGWLEIGKSPIIVEAIAKYNESMEAYYAGDAEKLEHFKRWASRSRELSHWRAKRRYQNLSLTDDSSPELIQHVSFTSAEIVNSPKGAANRETLSSEGADIRGEDDTKGMKTIEQKYKTALEYLQANNRSSALGVLRQIQEDIQNYRDVDILIAEIEKDIASRRKQPMLYKHSQPTGQIINKKA